MADFWFHRSIDTIKETPLKVGDAFRWDSMIWRVERIDHTGHCLKLWGPNDGPYPETIHGMSA